MSNKRNFLWITLIMVGIFGIVLFIFRGNERQADAPAEPTKMLNQGAPPNKFSPPRGVPVKNGGHGDDPAIVQEKLKEIVANRPINFYGKIVDENNSAIPGASIQLAWTKWAPEGYSEVMIKSDNDGLFSLTDVEGRRLLVNVSKGGYHPPSSSDNSFEYGDASDRRYHQPDPNNPVVFVLTQKGKAEPLIKTDIPGFGKTAQLPKDGTEVEFDINKGQIVKAGEGQIRISLYIGQTTKTEKKFDWKCRLSVPGGGIQQRKHALAFQAPAEGYLPFTEIEIAKSDDKQWRGDVQQTFFIKLANGSFGRLDFFVLARNGGFQLQSFINPTGSRNLELDPALQPK